jgi:hypothetical protein
MAHAGYLAADGAALADRLELEVEMTQTVTT